jgi:hypothetical protein
MKTICIGIVLIVLFSRLGWFSPVVESPNWISTTAKRQDDILKPIAPAISNGTGLLLEPPLDLSGFSKERFVELMESVGKEKIQKEWTSPVLRLEEHSRPDAQGLTHEEIKAYMRQAQQLFDNGQATPVSDVGLISTQEDVIRRPMLNHIAAFSNSAVRVYLLVQKTSTDTDWGYFSIVQDMIVDPPLD